MNVNYYNEFDKGAAAWLRELISQKLIPFGYVDDRSITEVTASDVQGFTQCHFFAGIGGWSYALQLAGVDPSTKLWTGSPPCQPFSTAGKQLGQLDERHLAPTFMRLVAQCRPPVLFGEQVAAAIGKHWLDDLFTELEAENYACGAAVLPAASVGAPHKRDRLFFGAHELADATSTRHLRCQSTASETGRKPEYESAGKLSTRPGGRAISDIQQSAGMGGVAESLRAEWHGERLQRPGEGYQAQGSRTTAESTGRSDFNRMADASVHGHTTTSRPPHVRRMEQQPGWEEGANEREQFTAERSAEPGRMVWTPANPHHGFWTDADWLGCRDGKFRPVEPGTFPLANGVPARVGRLRGYGNAIVPQVAAEFIKAFMSCK